MILIKLGTLESEKNIRHFENVIVYLKNGNVGAKYKVVKLVHLYVNKSVYDVSS